jgi:hypothetical protein
MLVNNIRKAVNYWSKFLKDALDDKFVAKDNGMGISTGSIFAITLSEAKLEREAKSITEEKIEIFKKELYKLIYKEVAQYKEYGRSQFYIGVDYDPNTILKKSCEAANLSSYMFPLKTCLVIDFDQDVVAVSQGYRAEYVNI